MSACPLVDLLCTDSFLITLIKETAELNLLRRSASFCALVLQVQPQPLQDHTVNVRFVDPVGSPLDGKVTDLAGKKRLWTGEVR